MNKTILVFVFLFSAFFTGTMFAQYTSDPSIASYRRLLNDNNSKLSPSSSRVEGSQFAFKSNSNSFIVYDVYGESHKVPGGNYDAFTDNVVSALGKDSVFVFSKKMIKSFRVNGVLFNRYINKENQKKFYAELTSGKGMVLLKSYVVIIKNGAIDPLTQHKISKDKFVLNEKYFLLNENNIVDEIQLRKKKILKLFVSHKDEIIDFVKINKLSFKSESDLIKLFNYYNSL
ncbi:MAG: hypothetical protein ACPG45_07030 [Flavobacteriaceae bacterium]